MDSRQRPRRSSRQARDNQPEQPQAPPQPPGQEDIVNEVMFENPQQQAWYDQYFRTKTIIVERPIIFEDFEDIGIRQIFNARGWVDYAKLSAPVYDCLVREFYSNALIVENRHLRIFVRGAIFHVTPVTIAEFFQSMRREQHPQYPYAEADLPELSMIGREVTNNPDFGWGRPNKYIKQGDLTDRNRILNLFTVNNLLPRAQKNQVYTEQAYLLYALGMGHTIDLPNLIIDQMVLTVLNKKPSLPYGMLVTQLCRNNGVIIDPTWKEVPHYGPLDKTSLKKSHGGQQEDQPEAQPAVPPPPQEEPFYPPPEEFIPPEQQPQEDQPYIPVDDRTDRQVLLGLEATLTQLDANMNRMNQRMTEYEQNQAEMLRLFRQHFGGGPFTS